MAEIRKICSEYNPDDIYNCDETGIFINIFKRYYVEMLTNQAIVNKYVHGRKVTKGEAWSLILYAWSQVKASTLRQCFRTSKVLPKTMADNLDERSADVQKRQSIYPQV
ncbi:hypothetical protein BGZ95_001230, partial [Linnemannia exigua]